MKEQREKRIRKTITTIKSYSIIINGKKEFGKRSFIYDDCKKSYYYIFYYIYNILYIFYIHFVYILHTFYIYFICITYFKTHVPEFVSEGLQLC